MEEDCLMVHRLVRVVVSLVNLPLYWIARGAPRRRNLWVFGEWFGEGYVDNSRVLFEYVSQSCPEIDAVWITQQAEIVTRVRSLGFRAEKAYGVRGYWTCLRAGMSFVSTSHADLNRFVRPMACLNLWHGIALKHVLFDFDHGTSNASLLWRVWEKVFPFDNASQRMPMVVSSEGERQRMARAFKLDPDLVYITGLPRNDALVRGGKSRQGAAKIVYLPTRRDGGRGDVLWWLLRDQAQIEAELEKLDAELYIKLHFHHDVSVLSGSERLRPIIDLEFDLYEFLSDVDVLVTDYSSVMFDFLLSGNPIVLAAFDLDHYLMNEGGMYFDYSVIAPGEICQDWSSVMRACADYLSSPAKDAVLRRSVTEEMHRYVDGEASRHVVDLAKSLAGA